MDTFYRIYYYTAFTVFVLTCIMVIFSLIVAGISFLYWSVIYLLQYVLKLI